MKQDIVEEYDDLWGDYKENPEINRSEDLIREQILVLEKKTSKKIRGTFSKIKYTKAGYKATMNALQQLFKYPTGITSPFDDYEEKTVEILDDELNGKRDINNSNNLELYKFEIYTDKYRFRIMEIVNSIAFPVRIILDEGIADELEMKTPATELSSNDDMYRFVSRVLQSRKVKNVINQMLVLTQTINDDDVIDCLTESGGLTVKQIAESLGWSQAVTYEKLSELQGKGKVEVMVDGKKARIYTVRET